jgi:cytoskeletal protein RodZ
MDVGTTLRTARERRALTLPQLAERTKIPVGILQALEQNAFDRVPRGIFVRGYLRAYSCEVGLDPGEMVDQFRTETGDVVVPELQPEAVAATDTHDDEIEPVRIDPNLTASRPGWGYLLMVAALLVAVVSVNRSDVQDEPDAVVAVGGEPALAAAEPAAASDAIQPVATAGPVVPATASAAGPSPLRFDIQTRGECWVEAVVDGRRVVYRLMLPGERQTIESEREIVLRVGDPAALTYSINGSAGEPLGRPGVPVTVRFTSAGERATLAS